LLGQFNDRRTVKDFEYFIRIGNVVVANRLSDEIRVVEEKVYRVYTRDLISRG